MTEQAKEARRAYNRAYYHAHKEERRKTNERYWNKRAERQSKQEEQGDEQTDND